MSPNGENFVIRYPSRTQEDLIIFNRDGANWRNLTDDKFRDRTPRWSPDGTKIAFASDRSGKYQIWMINADGSNLRQITFTEKTGAIRPDVFARRFKNRLFRNRRQKTNAAYSRFNKNLAAAKTRTAAADSKLSKAHLPSAIGRTTAKNYCFCFLKMKLRTRHRRL